MMATATRVRRGRYHFLDVGGQKYGECVLAIFGDIRILIDGGHEKDFEGQPGYASIPDQLAEILEAPAPHDITLTIVTHAHSDHLGCLPELVSHNRIRTQWALLVDPKLAFGRSVDDAIDRGVLSVDPREHLAAVLREEDPSDLDDDDLREFIDAVQKVEPRYNQFIKSLKAAGTKVVRYVGRPLPKRLRQLLVPAGFELLGPSQAQLLRCAEQIAQTNGDAVEAVDRLLRADARMDDVALYRAIVGAATDAAGNARGSGLNCQSITVALGGRSSRALLAGDMQFAEPGVDGADDDVAALRQKVESAGPYRLFKATHHTSHNGQDDELLDQLGPARLIVHSGGVRDASHPNPKALRMLKQRASSIRYARTDRNGRIEVSPHVRDDDDAIQLSKGRVNDFTDNVRDIEAPSSEIGPIAFQLEGAPTRAPLQVPERAEPAAPQIIIINLRSPAEIKIAGIDIVYRAHAGSADLPSPDLRTALKLAGGRPLPRLLFVTDPDALARNIGAMEARAALDAVSAAGQSLCRIDSTHADPTTMVRTALASRSDIAGVVLLGGYDVVPSFAVDVLGHRLRQVLGEDADVDGDDFVVWSDEPYGDLDGDRIGELPVSRVPDARDFRLFGRALQADAVAGNTRFGVRNVARPFAEQVWRAIQGTGAIEQSEKFLSSDVKSNATASCCHYFMLHGDDHDAGVFYGEYSSGSGYPRAFEVANVPRDFKGLVFTGCCWGALIVNQKAASGAGPIAPRVPESSIALSYLKAGANAFVGCTGSHYSGPEVGPELNYAAGLHAAFWDALPRNGYRAAPTLFSARKKYGADIARRAARQDALDVARRLKNRAQFTCLGLGW